MENSVRGITTIAAVLVALLMVFVLPAGLAAAAGPADAGSGTTVWAYGAVKTIDVTGTAGVWQYHGNATFGYSVILDQLNTSSNGSSFELTLNRTMGVLFNLDYCSPSCSHPLYTANQTYHSWETSDAWANFTTLGSVDEGGVSVPAIALVNTSSTVVGHLVVAGASSLPGANRSRSLTVNVAGEASVAFGTPLGLIPLDLTPSTSASWTSSSNFSAAGGATWNFVYAAAGPHGSISLSHNGSGAVARSGTVVAEGSYTVGNSVSFGGITYPAIQLTIVGPFSVREGFILAPQGADLFGSSAQPWTSNQSGTATASMSALDALPSSDGHFGVAASLWLYDAQGTVETSSIGGAPGTSGLVAATSSNPAPAPPTSLQGSPMSPDDAVSDQGCLISGTGCPSASGGSGSNPLPREIFEGGVVVGGIAVLVALVVVVTERRRMPPPAYPNANLYPPGTARAEPRPTNGRPAPSPSPPPEEDPLGHLW
jgi:hypothetical protein